MSLLSFLDKLNIDLLFELTKTLKNYGQISNFFFIYPKAKMLQVHEIYGQLLRKKLTTYKEEEILSIVRGRFGDIWNGGYTTRTLSCIFQEVVNFDVVKVLDLGRLSEHNLNHHLEYHLDPLAIDQLAIDNNLENHNLNYLNYTESQKFDARNNINKFQILLALPKFKNLERIIWQGFNLHFIQSILRILPNVILGKNFIYFFKNILTYFIRYKI